MTSAVWKTRLPVSPEELFEFHMDVANLEAISPPWAPVSVISEAKRAEVGDLQVFRIGAGPLIRIWEARVTRVAPGRLLEDVQESGPFRSWRHQHQFRPDGDGAVLADVVAFRLLPTRAGEFVEWVFVRPAILAMFAWRHRQTRKLLGV